MKRASFLISVFALVLLCVQPALAVPQSKGTGTSTLSGVVIGPDDKPVPHASVSYQVSDGSAPHAVHCDSQGHFAITKLKANNYDLRASSKGIFSEWEKNISVRRGQTKSIELRLIYAREMPKSASSKTKQ